MLRSMPSPEQDNVIRAEALADREERRVPPIARRIDLDRALGRRSVQRAAYALSGSRRAYRRLRRALHLPT
jgi:hypothetical protein